MLPSIKKSDGAKTKVPSKREQKKQINIRWNSGLFFQIGLIASLLLSIAAMEMEWETKPKQIGYKGPNFEMEEFVMGEYTVEPEKIPEKVEPVVEKRPVIQKVTLAATFKEVDNNAKTVETDTGSSELKDAPVAPTTPVTKKAEPTTPMVAGINNVDMIPVFPGCEGITDRREQLECLSSKIRGFVGRKFDTEKYSEKYAGQTLRINVQFTIDVNGNVANIFARSSGKDLEGEATKVMSKLPQMKPAKDKNRSVPVMYRMPIVFRAEY
ncbi:energy transducer TonB [Aureisphaera galaxeae]|uniref:energy transducer TonB n=1 Tax=Aureisphaera galaxeae TaxID=1538023 RepID=UPI0023500CF1|nr:energy transducer TonB [Aureisphaera galaxeae]MDC8005800.1 energy transducer TonB [Aureisphaera galaxeae]